MPNDSADLHARLALLEEFKRQINGNGQPGKLAMMDGRMNMLDQRIDLLAERILNLRWWIVITVLAGAAGSRTPEILRLFVVH